MAIFLQIVIDSVAVDTDNSFIELINEAETMDRRKRMSDIIETVGHALVRAKVAKLDRLGMPEINLTQFQHISVIQHHQDLTFGDLARILELSKPAVTAIVQKLSEQGFVTKQQSDRDRRVYHLRLTETGRQVAASYEESRLEYVDGIRQALSDDEFSQLLALMEKALHRPLGQGHGKFADRGSTA